VNRVKEHCNTHSKSHPVLLYTFPNGMTWCPVFKAGSTNWKQFFCKLYSPTAYQESVAMAENPDLLLANNIEPYCHIAKLDRFRKGTGPAKGPGKVQFLTVRHPYDRLVSAYNNKLKDCKGTYFTKTVMLDILKEYRLGADPAQSSGQLEAARTECLKPALNRTIDPGNPYMMPLGATFPEFIQYIVKLFKAGNAQNGHWAPVVSTCKLCQQRYDVIERFETLQRDHHYLFYKLDKMKLYPLMANRHDYPTDWLHKATSRPVIDYFKTLDKDLLWYLELLYKKDFELLGYKPHVYVI